MPVRSCWLLRMSTGVAVWWMAFDYHKQCWRLPAASSENTRLATAAWLRSVSVPRLDIAVTLSCQRFTVCHVISENDFCDSRLFIRCQFGLHMSSANCNRFLLRKIGLLCVVHRILFERYAVVGCFSFCRWCEWVVFVVVCVLAAAALLSWRHNQMVRYRVVCWGLFDSTLVCYDEVDTSLDAAKCCLVICWVFRNCSSPTSSIYRQHALPCVITLL